MCAKVSGRYSQTDPPRSTMSCSELCNAGGQYSYYVDVSYLCALKHQIRPVTQPLLSHVNETIIWKVPHHVVLL